MKAIIFLLIISLFLAGCTPEPLVGADKDEHGCIPSAGYTWCEVKQKCLREWEEPCVREGVATGEVGIEIAEPPKGN